MTEELTMQNRVDLQILFLAIVDCSKMSACSIRIQVTTTENQPCQNPVQVTLAALSDAGLRETPCRIILPSDSTYTKSADELLKDVKVSLVL